MLYPYHTPPSGKSIPNPYCFTLYMDRLAWYI